MTPIRTLATACALACFALADTLRNEANGGFRPAGSAGLKSDFTNPNDINGRTITGVQLGAIHRF